MFNLDQKYRRLALMGIRFVEGGDPAGGGTDPAPATDPATNPAPKPGDPAAAPSQQGQQQQTTETPEQIIARLEADVTRLNREKESVRIKEEGKIKQEAQRKSLLTLAEAAGIKIEDPDKETLQSLQEKLTGKVLQGDQESEQTANELRAARLELAVFRLAGEEKVDPARLTNRVSFVQATADLDPSAADFNDKLKAAIQAEVKNDSTLKAGGPGSSTSGADQYGGAGGDQITQEAFDKMSFAERSALYKRNPELHNRLANG